jgi:hypothetical protein
MEDNLLSHDFLIGTIGSTSRLDFEYLGRSDVERLLSFQRKGLIKRYQNQRHLIRK